MKILIRILGIVAIALLVSLSSIYLMNTNDIANELNDASALAMLQTQNVMKKVVVSRLDREEKNLFSNATYEEYYEKCFKDAVIDPSLYKLDVIGDYSKGVLFVEINTPNYRLIPKKKLLNIVNVEGEELNDIESHYYEEVVVKQLDKLSKTRWQGIKAKTLETWNFDEPTKILGADIEIYSIEYKSGNYNTRLGPSIEFVCEDKDGKVVTIDEDEGGYCESSYIDFDECIECKMAELIMTKDINLSDYGLKTDTIVAAKGGGIYLEKIELKEKEDYKLSKDCHIYSRYIDDIEKLNESSIWLQDENYTNTLKEFINKTK